MALPRETGRILRGLAFIAPNVAGFLVFTLVPLVLSFVMAFTNWDLQQHNMFRDEFVRFVGLANFLQLFRDPHFWQYLGNTFFLLMGIPFGIAGSLGAALLLHRNPGAGYRGPRRLLWCSAILVASCFVLAATGFRASALMILLSSTFGLVLIGGIAGGSTLYRTLFYLPHFTQGVAIFILWKKLYNPTSGPINLALLPALEVVEQAARRVPQGAGSAALALAAVLMALLWGWGARALLRAWAEGDRGTLSLALGLAIAAIPLALALRWFPATVAWPLVAACAALLAWNGARARQRQFRAGCTPAHGIGAALLQGGLLLVGLMVLAGIGLTLLQLPQWSREGLQPPLWLAGYHWAKPSLMIISLWAAIGSNNMILYLAGLSNISPELYEAADIDGAGRWQKFCHITWPQLAPVTFFIVIMSFIYGLQGGFEMARTMTKGGPAGATTTLSYFVYSEGFETGRLGYASAVAWVLFLLVLVATLFNWRFGNRYVAD